MISSWRRLLSSVPAYFIIDGHGRMRLAGLQLVDEALAHRREGEGVDVEGGDLGAQQRIVDRLDRLRRASACSPPRPMPLIISRSWPSRYLATSQPLFTSPTTWSLGTFTSSKKVSQKGELPLISRIGLVETPGRLHVEQQEADPAMLGLGRGADQAEDPVGLVGVAGPHLLAVDQPVVALVLGLGLQAGEIGAGARLRIALAPADFAARDLGQVSASSAPRCRT